MPAKSLTDRILALRVLVESRREFRQGMLTAYVELMVSWRQTMVEVFRGLLDETVQSVHVCGEDIEISDNFTYIC